MAQGARSASSLALQPSRWGLGQAENPFRHFSLLRGLVAKELSARYRGSLIGRLWPVVNYLFQILILTYVFSVILELSAPKLGVPKTKWDFAIWLFTALLPWNASTSAFAAAATSVSSQPNLVKKVVFPVKLLPLVPVAANFVEACLGLLVLIAILLVNYGMLLPTALLLPVFFVPQLLLTAGLGYALAGLTVFIRDVPQIVSLVLQAWFYLTPIVYPISRVPENLQPWLLALNPFAALVESYRELLLIGTVPAVGIWLPLLIGSLAVYGIGALLFRKLKPAFSDVL